MDDDALRDLLTRPLEAEAPARRGRWITGLGLATVVFVALGLLVAGDDEEPAEASTVAGSSVPTTIPIAVPTTTPVSSFQYPDGRITGTLVYDPTVDGVVMLGGWTVFRAPPVVDPWLFDATAATWVSIAATLEPSGRELAPAVFVDSVERIAVFGGTPDQTMQCGRWDRVLAAPVDTWYLDTASRAWERVTTVGGPPDRWGHGVAYDPEADVVVMFGGVSTEFENSGFSRLRDDTWIYDPATATWTQVETDVAPSPRACAGMVHDRASGSIVLWGGTTTSSEGDRSVWRFDTETLSWTEFPPLGDSGPERRWLHQTVLVDGSVIVIGGLYPQVALIEGGTTTTIGATDEVWSLDLSTGSWEQLGSAPFEMWGHAAAAVGGRIVVSAFGSTLLYDPASDVWTDVTPYDELDWPALDDD